MKYGFWDVTVLPEDIHLINLFWDDYSTRRQPYLNLFWDVIILSENSHLINFFWDDYSTRRQPY
jgi:hypothetical protein